MSKGFKQNTTCIIVYEVKPGQWKDLGYQRTDIGSGFIQYFHYSCEIRRWRMC